MANWPRTGHGRGHTAMAIARGAKWPAQFDLRSLIGLDQTTYVRLACPRSGRTCESLANSTISSSECAVMQLHAWLAKPGWSPDWYCPDSTV